MSDDPNGKVGDDTAAWNNRGWNGRPVTIQTETFDYLGEKRYRPKTITGILRNVTGPARDIKVVSLALCEKFTPWNAWQWDPEEDTESKRDYDKGHLMALSLGGPDHPANCAPMLHGGNIGGEWKTLEQDVKKTLPTGGTSNLAYQRVKLILTLGYGVDANGDPRIPTSFDVTVEFCDVDGNRIEADTVTDRDGIEWKNPFSKPIPQTNPPERTLTLYTKLASLFADAETRMGLKKELKGEGPCKNKEVPYWVLQAFHLEDPNLSPLWKEAVVELGTDTNAKFYLPVKPFAFQKGGKISRAQRFLILCYNRWKTGGTVQSDVEKHVDGKHQTFSEHKVEIDHKDPSGKAGDNSYPNLQVTSRQWNNKKRDTKMEILI